MKDYSSTTFDELLDEQGNARPAAIELVDFMNGLGAAGRAERREDAERAIRQMGITFTVYSTEGNIDREWPFDIIPRIIDAREWQTVERGLKQRLKALNLFIDDLYHKREIINDRVVPAYIIDSSAHYLDACRDVSPPHAVWAHICGSDLVRDKDGTLFALEDNLRVPSGVSYMLENREVMKRTLPEVFGSCKVRPVDGYPGMLQRMLRSLSQESEPSLAVLTPGIYNSAYFEHVYLAQQIGAELVEGRDLVVTDDDELCVRNVNGLQRIDVLYRRVDDAFIDPDVFVEDSMLGVRGLMRAWKAGRVAIANAPGAGVADDKVVYSFVPDIIEYYLNEKPQLANVETYRCADPEHRDYVLNHLDELVVKPANESGGYGLLIGPHATPEEREATAQSIRGEPRNWIAQPTLAISTAPTLTDNGIAARHVDLRPFVLQGETLAVSTGGLTRVALREGSLVVNSSQGGGSKDTWIVDLDEGTASSGSDHEQLDSSQSQSQTTRPTLGALPPLPPESRLLARNAENLYWLGRYLERAECTARFIDTHARLMMDVGNDRRGIGWTSLITITGNEEAFEKTGAVNNEAGICHFLIGEPENPGSLLNIAIAMHENLRSTREFLPSSVYESFSALCRSVRAGAPHSAQAPQRTRFLADIEQRLLALAGSIDGSLSRGTGWLAMRMGVHLERADMTSRVLDVRSQMLINDEHSLAPTITEREWMSVLSSLMALRMYRLHVNRPIDGGEVLRYLLDDPDLPRAWRYCVDRLRACVRQLGRAEVPNAALDALMHKIDSADLSALAADRVALHNFIDDLQLGLYAVGDAITQTYFPPPEDLTETESDKSRDA
jgi:uncharacterized circularly permuted ATP-grasp superfamily protein/uncharacterized alpha-E superfamily protein